MRLSFTKMHLFQGNAHVSYEISHSFEATSDADAIAQFDAFLRLPRVYQVHAGHELHTRPIAWCDFWGGQLTLEEEAGTGIAWISGHWHKAPELQYYIDHARKNRQDILIRDQLQCPVDEADFLAYLRQNFKANNKSTVSEKEYAILFVLRYLRATRLPLLSDTPYSFVTEYTKTYSSNWQGVFCPLSCWDVSWWERKPSDFSYQLQDNTIVFSWPRGKQRIFFDLDQIVKFIYQETHRSLRGGN